MGRGTAALHTGAFALSVLLTACSDVPLRLGGSEPANLPAAEIGSRPPIGDHVPGSPLGSPSSGASATQQQSRARQARARYAFDRGLDGFRIRFPKPDAYATIEWDSAARRVRLFNTGGYAGHELLAHSLPFPLTPRSTFSVSARFGVIEQGNQRALLMLVLTGASDDLLTHSTVMLRYSARDGNLGQDPAFRIEYVDGRARTWLLEPARLPVDPEYRVTISYAAISRRLSIAMEDSLGRPAHGASYTIGTAADDGFVFTSVAMATAGRAGQTPEPAVEAWVDDIEVAVTSA